MAKPSPWTDINSIKYATVKNVSDILDLTNIPDDTVKQYIDDKSVNMGIFYMDGGTRKYIRGNEGETGLFLVDVSSMYVEQHETYLVSAEFYDTFSTYAITLFDSDSRNTLVDFCEVDDSQGYHYIEILVNEEESVLQIIKLSGSSNFIVRDSLTGSRTDSLITQKIGIKNCIDISYSDLRSLKSSNKLIPGVQYRITDYQARTTQSGTSALTNYFDIIVTAESRDKLSEDAKAIQKDSTTYFNNSKLEAWELKYCLDNDTNRFAWADSGSTGRGVIYYMKDEFNNEAWFDFKNIKIQANLTGSNNYYYLFTKDITASTITDDTITSGSTSRNNSVGKAYTDTIPSTPTTVPTFTNVMAINRCVFGNGAVNNVVGMGWSSMSVNKFLGTYNNIVGNYCQGNLFQNTFGNTILDDCYNNTIKNSYDNTFSKGCHDISINYGWNNKFEDGAHTITINGTSASPSYGNEFKKNSRSHVLGNDARYNIFGEGTEGNTLGDVNHGNRFEQYANNNTLAASCSYNVFNEQCSGNSLPTYCRYIVFKGNNKNLSFSKTSGTYLWYLDIEKGLSDKTISISAESNYNNAYPRSIYMTDVTPGYSIIRQWGDLETMENITYANLVARKNQSNLVAGKAYRITDYQARTTQAGTTASTNYFDIIVTAESRDKLSEDAKAIQRSGTTYFNNSKLEAWELKYCLDNDTDRFAWADSGSTGRGVIYYMKDEFGNEAPYDFKNIKFQRFPLSNPVVYRYDEAGIQYIIDEDQSLLEELSSTLRGYGTANTDTWVGIDYNYAVSEYEHRLTYSAGTASYLYTFGGSVDKSLSATTVTATNNVILPYIDSDGKQTLNSIVIDANNISGNTFGNNCNSITIRTSCNNNEIGNECSDFDVASLFDNIIRKGCKNIYSNYFYKNIIGYNTTYLTFDVCGYSVVGLYCNHITMINSVSNTIGNLVEDVYMLSESNGNRILNAQEESCIYTIRLNGSNNIIDGGSSSYNITINGSWNKLGTDCRDITLNSGCNYNSFGINCFNITLGINCTNNSFGNNCNGNNFGSTCSNNTFQNDCDWNTFGSDCSNNFLENGVNHFNFGATAGRSHHYHNVIVETGNQYIKLDCTSTLSGTVRYRNAKLLQGINNTSTYKTITDSNTGNQTYQTVYQPADSITINV